jgi:hypothetical protein
MITLFLKALPMNTGINFRAMVALRIAPYINIIPQIINYIKIYVERGVMWMEASKVVFICH